jgi:hypothetical protein
MKKYFAFVAMTLFAGSLALANHMGGGPCAKDAETLCKDAKGEHKAVMMCMKSHEAQLSAECRAHIEKHKAMMAEVKEACAEDVEKFCENVEPGKGKVMMCLKDHSKDLSQGCKDEIAKVKKEHKSK